MCAVVENVRNKKKKLSIINREYLICDYPICV